MGKRGREEHLLGDQRQLARVGAEVFASPRGGEVRPRPSQLDDLVATHRSPHHCTDMWLRRASGRSVSLRRHMCIGQFAS